MLNLLYKDRAISFHFLSTEIIIFKNHKCLLYQVLFFCILWNSHTIFLLDLLMQLITLINLLIVNHSFMPALCFVLNTWLEIRVLLTQDYVHFMCFTRDLIIFSGSELHFLIAVIRQDYETSTVISVMWIKVVLFKSI